MPATRRPWHRLFGIALTDLFAGTPWRIEVEVELALKSQRLDLAIVSTTETAAPTAGLELPDGFDGLCRYTLVTFKSQHEPLTWWVLTELIGHYVSYRKRMTDRSGNLLPETAFGLTAVTVRSPRTPAVRDWLQPTGVPGVFDISWGDRHLRVVVLSEIETHARNAPWHLFSARADQVRFGVHHYRARRPGTWGLIARLLRIYEWELPKMSDLMEELMRETREEMIADLTDEQLQAILDRIPPEQRLRGLDPEVRVRGLDPEVRVRDVDPEVRVRGLSVDERMRGLSEDDIRQIVERYGKPTAH